MQSKPHHQTHKNNRRDNLHETQQINKQYPSQTMQPLKKEIEPIPKWWKKQTRIHHQPSWKKQTKKKRQWQKNKKHYTRKLKNHNKQHSLQFHHNPTEINILDFVILSDMPDQGIYQITKKNNNICALYRNNAITYHEENTLTKVNTKEHQWREWQQYPHYIDTTNKDHFWWFNKILNN